VSVLLDRHCSRARDHLRQLPLDRARVADELVVVREGAEDFPIGAVDGCGPAGAKPVLERQVLEVRPQRIVGDVENGDGPVMRRRCTAGADLGSDLDPVDRRVVRVGQPRTCAVQRAAPCWSRMRMEPIIPDGVIASTKRISSSSVSRSGVPEEIISSMRFCALSSASRSSCGSVVMVRRCDAELVPSPRKGEHFSSPCSAPL
jgi:hypothetical protein